MSRIFGLAYGVGAYVLFLGVFLYAIGFVGGFLVPKTIDTGPTTSMAGAILIDTALLLLFALQHSVMARQGFKEWWTKLVPESVERSTYVLFASLVLGLVMWQWRPIPEVVWSVENAAGEAVLWGVFGLGWSLVLLATVLINHFELFGLQQVWFNLRGREHEPPRFQTPGFYRLVRHPLYLGFILAFWATPTMTAGHLLFAVATTGYMLLAIQLEERDLMRFHGEAYENYRQRVRMLIPLPKTEGGASSEAAGPERPLE